MIIHWVDIVIALTIGISMIISIYRGFVLEAISFVTWVFSLAIARIFASELSVLLTPWIQSSAGRMALASLLLFLMTWLVGGTIGMAMKRFVDGAGLDVIDRGMGTFFGFIRGCLMVLLVVGITNWLGFFDDITWWQDSLILPHFLVLEDWTKKIVQDMFSGESNVGAVELTAY